MGSSIYTRAPPASTSGELPGFPRRQPAQPLSSRPLQGKSALPYLLRPRAGLPPLLPPSRPPAGHAGLTFQGDGKQPLPIASSATTLTQPLSCVGPSPQRPSPTLPPLWRFSEDQHVAPAPGAFVPALPSPGRPLSSHRHTALSGSWASPRTVVLLTCHRCVCTSLSHVRLFCDPRDCSPPGRRLWNSPGKSTGVGAMPFSRGSSRPQN